MLSYHFTIDCFVKHRYFQHWFLMINHELFSLNYYSYFYHHFFLLFMEHTLLKHKFTVNETFLSANCKVQKLTCSSYFSFLSVTWFAESTVCWVRFNTLLSVPGGKATCQVKKKKCSNVWNPTLKIKFCFDVNSKEGTSFYIELNWLLNVKARWVSYTNIHYLFMNIFQHRKGEEMIWDFSKSNR